MNTLQHPHEFLDLLPMSLDERCWKKIGKERRTFTERDLKFARCSFETLFFEHSRCVVEDRGTALDALTHICALE